MSSTLEYDQLDDNMKALLDKLLKKEVAKVTGDVKPTCPAAVHCTSKDKIKKKINGGHDVYLEDYLDGNNRRQTRAWTQCTRSCWKPDGEDGYRTYCFKHEESAVTKNFSEYIDSEKVRPATLKDPYLNKKAKSAIKSTIDEKALQIFLVKNPELSSKLTELYDTLIEYQNQLGEGTKPSEMKANDDSDNEAESDNESDEDEAEDEAEAEAEAEAESDDGEESSDGEEIEAVEMLTTSGRSFMIDPNTLNAYSDESGDMEVVGKLYKVTLKKAPLMKKDQLDDFDDHGIEGSKWIIGTPCEDRIRCIITDGAFKLNKSKDVYKKVGNYKVKKDGEIIFKKI